MASCPTCNKDVDPLRARATRVIGGRIVAFCSPECAAGEAKKPEPEAKKPAAEAKKPAAEAKKPAAEAKKPAAEAKKPEPAKPATAAATAATAATSVDTPLSADRPRSQRLTNPVEPGDVVEEHDAVVPRRARTEPPVPPPRRRRRRGLVLMFAGAIVVGGMAIAIVQAVSPSSPETAGAASNRPPSGSGATPETPARPPPVAPVVDRVADARAVLAELVKGDSERVKRIAAAALARTGDPEALAVLGAMLETETSDITRLDIAYALARANDERGTKALVAAAQRGRRDVKADAARMLILLGDPGGEGAKALASFVDMRTHRLGAAEALARVADPKAIAALTAIHDDQTAAADDRIRAAIALGRAKRKEVAPELVELLGDMRFNAFAAAALADLGDPAAKPVLVKQLEVPSLRVGAAVALRRLDPALDPEPILAPLLAAAAADKDVARVTAAEAILVLTGPPAWAERD
jgi:HEAT repeat protein